MSTPHTVQHFTHNHPLTEVNGVGTFTCDGCKLYGDGKTYRCSDCDYDLHEYCATCPQLLRNTCHNPDHELNLYSGPTHTTERSCHVCRVYIQGMFYICKHCNFESHPLCTHVLMHASSPDATVTQQRSLHGPGGPGLAPSPPHQFGQGNPNGYPHMGPHVPYPYGGNHHQQPHQQPHMNPGSPKADPKASPSTSTTKKKKPGFMGAMKTAAAATFTLATQLAVATMTDGEYATE